MLRRRYGMHLLRFRNLWRLGIAAAFALGGCGRPKAEQCKALATVVEKAERARVPGDASTREARKKYYDDMLAVKDELGKVEVGDDKLVALRDKEAKNLEDFIFAQRGIEKSVVPSELDEAVAKRSRILKEHDQNLAELGSYCGVDVPRSMPAERPSSSAPPGGIDRAR